MTSLDPIIGEATREAVFDLVPVIANLETAPHWPFPARREFLSQVATYIVIDPPADMPPSMTGTEDIGFSLRALVPFLMEMPERTDLPEPCRASHLIALAEEAIRRADLPVDKIARWAGFVSGCIQAQGITIDEPSQYQMGLHKAPNYLDLSRMLGFVQGILATRRAIDVKIERERTRPIFHAAYAKAGLSRPPSIGLGNQG